jgi:hypothetical protein
MVRNRGPKGKQSLGIAIMSIVEVDLSLYLVLDKLRNGKVGLSEVAFHDFLALFFDCRYMGTYLESILRADQSNTFRQQSHNSLPFVVRALFED